MTHSLVSVIIPVFNGERYVAEAIQSVLNQDYEALEIIVMDDGSTDESRQAIRRFGGRLRYFFQNNAGLGAARNAGFAEAKGDLIAFLDADDRWVPHKLTLQSQILADDPSLDMVFGLTKQFYSPELTEYLNKSLPESKRVAAGRLASNMLIRRRSFERVGPFATHWRVGEFVDWCSKAEEKKLKSVMLNAIVLERRIHNRNMGIVSRDSRIDYVEILKASLDRKRKEAPRNIFSR